jgi:adenylosuccinate lyase
MHDNLRKLAMKAWSEVQMGQPNPLPKLIVNDKELLGYLSEASLQDLMDVQEYVGNAPQRARDLAARIRNELL